MTNRTRNALVGGLVVWVLVIVGLVVVMTSAGSGEDVHTVAEPSTTLPASRVSTSTSSSTTTSSTTSTTIPSVDTTIPGAAPATVPASAPRPAALPATTVPPPAPATTAEVRRTINVSYIVPFLTHARDSQCNREKYWSTFTVDLRDQDYVLMDTQTIPAFGRWVLEDKYGAGHCEFDVAHPTPDRPSWEFIYEDESNRADREELSAKNWHISLILGI